MFGIAPTGSGKTLAFLLPIMMGIRRHLHTPGGPQRLKGESAALAAALAAPQAPSRSAVLTGVAHRAGIFLQVSRRWS